MGGGKKREAFHSFPRNTDKLNVLQLSRAQTLKIFKKSSLRKELTAMREI